VAPKGPARVWLDAARPATLSAAIVPVLVGSATAVGQGRFRADVLLAALVAALLIQIGANYANDFFDFRRGADSPDRLGPPRATATGLVPPERMREAAVGTFAAALIPGAYLVWLGGPPVLAVGLASILAAVSYTGPLAYGYRGLGDLACFVFFGLLPVATMHYLHSDSLSASALIASVPVACLVTAILVVNNLRDIETDRRAGKRTLAVLIGRDATRVYYALLLMFGYLVPPIAWALDAFPLSAVLPALSVPYALALGDIVSHREGGDLNAALVGTSRLHLVFGTLFALGLALRL
jgi:1,4-dihydroxy-2-naphthoate octaprenyltransferase